MSARSVSCVLVCCALSALCALGATPAAAQGGQMPNPKEISGVPLPAQDVPVGTVSVRVVRGAFTSNVAKQPVEITVDAKTETKTTDDQGRAVVSGLKPGTKVRVVTVVDGERIESQEMTIGNTGYRVVLVATDPEAVKRAAEDKALAAGPAVRGVVVLGPESRVIAEFNDDRLNIYYVLDVLNTARTPVDPGGPLIIDLPHDSRGASLLQGSSVQATLTGGRITITGPFAPGSTSVQAGFQLLYDGATAHIDQKWPVSLQEVTVLLAQSGALDFQSPQVATKRTVTDQGQPLLVGGGPALPAGKTFTLEIQHLPHHATWPRDVALGLAGVILSAGLWAAVVPSPRRRKA